MDIFLATLFILICILLIAVVLLQKGRGGGLSGAFGGAGGHTAFGSRTGDMFTWVTVVLVALFLLMGVLLVLKFRPDKQVIEQPALVAPTAPETAPVTQPTTESDEEVVEPATAPAATAPADQPPQPPAEEATTQPADE